MGVKNFRTTLITTVVISAIATISLTGCSSEERASQTLESPTAVSKVDVQKVLEDLSKIAQASLDRQEVDGVTETFSVNSQGTAFDGNGEVTFTAAYDPATKKSIRRYPTNPSYRETDPQTHAIGIALASVEGYKTGDPAPTEKDGVFTFEAPPEYDQVTIIYTKDGLVTGVLLQDSLNDPSYTNFYEVNFYNITNPIADRILKTKE